jgi:hypothetical protein
MPENLLQPETDKATPERPQDVPEKFWDPERRAIRVEALLKSYRELERRLSQRERPPGPDAAPEELARFRALLGVPESPDAYQIRAPHDLCCADPEVNRRLHAANFTNEQAQLVYELAAERLLPLIAEAAAEFEAERQREKLHAHFGGPERFRKVAAQLSAWGRANLPPPVFEALSSTAEGVLALEQMMRKGEPTLSREAVPPKAESEQELRAMMRDPRYWRTREPEFVRRVTEGFRRLVNG